MLIAVHGVNKRIVKRWKRNQKHRMENVSIPAGMTSRKHERKTQETLYTYFPEKTQVR